MKFTCPCCGFKTFDGEAIGTYEICELCNWEDDPIQNKDPDYEGGANGYSLREGQHFFLTENIDTDAYEKDEGWHLLEPPSKIKGSEKVKMYESSSWASRGFCSECGTHLFYKLKKSGEYNMPVGMFQGLEGLEMDMQYFSDQRPDYYCFSNQTKEMTKAEIMEYFSKHV